MGTLHAREQAWQNSHYCAVHGALQRLRDSAGSALPAGTEGVIGRAQFHFANAGDAGAAGRLEAISTTLFQLRWAKWTGREAELRESELKLHALAEQWLLEAPMILPGQGA